MPFSIRLVYLEKLEDIIIEKALTIMLSAIKFFIRTLIFSRL